MKPIQTVDAYPLSWPPAWKRTPRHTRKPAPFHRLVQARDGAGNALAWKRKEPLAVGQAMELLRRELKLLYAQRITISSNLHLREDGLPYAKQAKMLEDPGVAVYFTLKGASRVLACDKWSSVADNLAAIAHHIDALRAVDRYGVGFLEQAFAGYTALPPAVGHDWRIVLGFTKDELVTPELIEQEYKKRAKKAHPDAGGSQTDMARLNAARDVALAELTP